MPRVTIYLSDAVLAAVQRAAEKAGSSFSQWVVGAIKLRSSLDTGIVDADEMIAEWEAEHGPTPPEVIDWAEHELDRLGVPRPADPATGSETDARTA